MRLCVSTAAGPLQRVVRKAKVCHDTHASDDAFGDSEQLEVIS